MANGFVEQGIQTELLVCARSGPGEEVLKNIIQAAKNAKPGIKLTEAERINDDGKVRYELEGNLIKEQFEFLISEEGILIEMELDDD